VRRWGFCAGAALTCLLWGAAPSASAADAARALEIVQGKCFICHGAEGESSSPVFPRLAGQHAAYTENQLKKFNTRERTNDNAVMHSIASKLTELEVKAVSLFVSGLQ
jgi:cytochrome c553